MEKAWGRDWVVVACRLKRGLLVRLNSFLQMQITQDVHIIGTAIDTTVYLSNKHLINKLYSTPCLIFAL